MTGTIERIAVIGAGTMGHGIAQVAAQSGLRTALYDVEASLAEEGLARIGENLRKGVAAGKVAAADADAALARVVATGSLEAAVRDADLVIEAAPEKMDLKTKLFREVSSLAPASAILATNTSSLSVSEIARAAARPERVLGMHFFNPPWVLKLLELVRAERTSDETLERARAIAGRLGREVITVSDTPGFATSRLGLVIGLEAMRMLEEGVASAEDIDRAMKLGYRHPMGPLELTDLVGLDVRLDIARYLDRQLPGGRFRPPAILERMVKEGKLGKKTGEGFYRWD
jgi:3-hydroxybutyryl-CoA dehydrogenase